MATRLSAIVIEALDVRAQARFWAQALDWRIVEGVPEVAVRPADEDGIGLLFVPTTRPKATKNRLHLDLAGGAERVPGLLALGATRADIGQGDVPWDVLADLEGNEFCVLPQAESDGRLAAICQDAADVAVQGRFWTAVTGWSIVDRGDWGIRMRGTSGTGPALVMGPPAAPKSGPNRLRFSVTTDRGDDLPAELASAGPLDAGPVTLTDPEGNEFRLLVV